MFWSGAEREDLLCFSILANITLDLQSSAVARAAELQSWGLEPDQSPRADKREALTTWLLRKGLCGFSFDSLEWK